MVDEQRPPLRLWIIGAVAAVALHAGGAALAFAHLRSSNDFDSLGSNVAAIDVDLVAPSAEQTDLPPGPEADASVASPALAEQKAEVKPTELPKDIPQETDDADRTARSTSSLVPAGTCATTSSAFEGLTSAIQRSESLARHSPPMKWRSLAGAVTGRRWRRRPVPTRA